MQWCCHLLPDATALSCLNWHVQLFGAYCSFIVGAIKGPKHQPFPPLNLLQLKIRPIERSLHIAVYTMLSYIWCSKIRLIQEIALPLQRGIPKGRPRQRSAILSESVRNRDTGKPGISISIDFGKFPGSVSISQSILTKICYPTQ